MVFVTHVLLLIRRNAVKSEHDRAPDYVNATHKGAYLKV